MVTLTRQASALAAFGTRLRAARLERGDTMSVFAQRIGASESTLRAMEKGLPTVQAGFWIEALWVLDRLDELDPVLAARTGVLDQARAAVRPRQRAPRRPRER